MLGLGLPGFGLGARDDGKFNPVSLFSGGVKGVLLDPYVAASMFTDTGGSTQAVANDLVARINDLSGNGFNATQATSGNRPTLIHSGAKRSLRFNGSSSKMATASIDLSGGDTITVAAAIRKSSDAAIGCVVEFSTNISTNNGTFAMLAPAQAGGATAANFSSKGTALQSAGTGAASYPAPIDLGMIAEADISAPYARLEVNGVDVTPNTASQGTGNYGNHVLNIGVRAGSLYLNGDFHRFMLLTRSISASEKASLRAWLNAGISGAV